MFEKEAQEWVKTHTKIENKESYVELKGPSAIKSFEAGAEFGYNKCKEELNQKGLALQSDIVMKQTVISLMDVFMVMIILMIIAMKIKTVIIVATKRKMKLKMTQKIIKNI